MKYNNFDEITFRSNVDNALRQVDRILQVQRNPRLAEEVDHEYGNKYDIANVVTNVAVIAIVACFERMGLTADIQRGLDKTKTTTLRFEASNTCDFLTENEVEVPMERSTETTETTQTTGSSFFGTTTKATVTRAVKRIKEYHWKVGMRWEISVYSGTEVERKVVLQSRESSTVVVVQSTKIPPIAGRLLRGPPLEVSLAWLLKQIDTAKMLSHFKIDTTDEGTKTPLRNKQVDDAREFMGNLGSWSDQVRGYFAGTVQRGIINKHNPVGGPPPGASPALTANLSEGGVFNPILPLMEEQDPPNRSEAGDPADSKGADEDTVAGVSMVGLAAGAPDSEKSGSLFLSHKDMTKVINEHHRSLDEKLQNLQNSFPAKHLAKPVSVAEAEVYLLCHHLPSLCNMYANSVLYIEWMLERQLVAAIGKRVDSADLDKFVRFHNGKLLDPAPKPFCHSIRRPQHYPDGVLSIEGQDAYGDNKKEPIETFVRDVEMPTSLKVPLSAAATVEMTGKAFLHGWLQHRFRDTSKRHELIARARQFSSFLLIVGTMAGPDELDPQDAIILRDKDELIIPLLLNELPSAKEFKDAIRSLSPEQQRFARSFRSMQLGTSVLGVCIVQIKPQLEELLCLPADALTKEMKLTQDLMELFVEYQVPSDLLSYDGESPDAGVKDKVENVRDHVEAVLGVIDAAKNRQLEEQTQRAVSRVAASVADELEDTARSARRMCSRSLSSAELPVCWAPPPPSSPMMAMAAMPQPLAAPRSVVSRRAARSRRRDVPQDSLGDLSSTMSMIAASKEVGAASLGELERQRDAVGALQSEANWADDDFVGLDAARADGGASQTYTTAKPDNLTNEPVKGTGQPTEGRAADFTEMPKMLDALIEKHDKDGSLCSTVIKTDGSSWTRRRYPDLLSKSPNVDALRPDDIKSEKDKAFDLLDALSRSGSLPIACAELHVIVCLTHRFEKDVMGTVIQDNVNPIEKLEMSSLLLASSIHGVAPRRLVRDTKEADRLAGSFPLLLGN